VYGCNLSFLKLLIKSPVYRRLNAATIKNNAPLPRLDETLDQLAGAKYFISLDLHSAYQQFNIAYSDVPKTSFKTLMGQFQFKVLPFGLSNAPATFHTAMNRFFAPYMHKFVVIYVNDIMIYSKSQ
jgi:Reverse transcriptase (RNA-dependent DNA polymerase)